MKHTPFLALALALLLGGCSTTEVIMLTPLAGGEMFKVRMGPAGPVLAEDERASVEFTSFTINKEARQVNYLFKFRLKKPAPMKSVKVEDLSDEVAQTVLEDAAPKTDASLSWQGAMPPINSGDSRLTWLFHEGNSIRVHRITIEYVDGNRSVLMQPSTYPGVVRRCFARSSGCDRIGRFQTMLAP
jgi:hypothetical protein